MQAMKWSRERLEELTADLLADNKRLQRINWGRMIAVSFFTFWATLTWMYYESPVQNSKSCKCAVKDCKQKE